MLPEIQVSAGQGKFIYLLAKMINARRILELGTLGSTRQFG
jgi:predicted O-methyltransferase YrrM